MTVRLAHIGIAVRSIADARNFYEEVLGLEVEEVEEIPSEGARVAILPFPGGEVELIEPLAEDTPVGRFLERHGEGLHHVSFDVPDVRRTILAGIEHGVETVGEAPRAGAGGREIAFFHPLFTHGVLVEVAGPKAGAPASDVTREMKELGRRMGEVLQGAWEREDVRAGLRSFVDEVDRGVERVRESTAAARAREGAREAGRKARGGLVESLRWLSGRLGTMAERVSAEDAADGAPAPPAADGDPPPA